MEDDDALRISVGINFFRKWDIRLFTAATGAVALQVWAEHQGARIQLVLTNLVMPGGMSGKELGERLRRERAGCENHLCLGLQRGNSGRR